MIMSKKKVCLIEHAQSVRPLLNTSITLFPLVVYINYQYIIFKYTNRIR